MYLQGQPVHKEQPSYLKHANAHVIGRLAQSL